MTEPFIGLNDLSDALGEDVSTSDLAIIAIDSACEQVRGELGNRVNLVEDDEITLDGKGAPRLILPEPPVREVTEVQIYGEADPMLTTDYTLESRGQLHGCFLRRVGTGAVPSLINNYYGNTQPVWPIGLGNISITYTHGWDIVEPLSDPPAGFERVPSAIRQVALTLATRIYRNFGAGGATGATTSLRLGSAAETYDVATAVAAASTQITEDEVAALRPWKTLVFA